MAAALAVLEREEDLRTMAHEELDRWLDQLDAETVKGPTLRDLSERVLATRSQLLSACLEPVIRQPYAAELEQTEAVCGCGRQLRRRRVDAKEISTLHGRLTLPRPYCYCDACGRGFHPVDGRRNGGVGPGAKRKGFDSPCWVRTTVCSMWPAGTRWPTRRSCRARLVSWPCGSPTTRCASRWSPTGRSGSGTCAGTTSPRAKRFWTTTTVRSTCTRPPVRSTARGRWRRTSGPRPR